jgi:hypothetical protein
MGKIIGVGDFQSITRVVFHEPAPEIAERYPFACVFKEADKQEAANPEMIAGIHVDFGATEQYVVCATDDEILVFRADRECEEAEQERLGIKPAKVEKESVPAGPIPGQLIIPGQPQKPASAGAILKEEWGKAWSCTAWEDVPPDTMKKIEKLLGKVL